jgi:hypothetical protein
MDSAPDMEKIGVCQGVKVDATEESLWSGGMRRLDKNKLAALLIGGAIEVSEVEGWRPADDTGGIANDNEPVVAWNVGGGRLANANAEELVETSGNDTLGEDATSGILTQDIKTDSVEVADVKISNGVVKAVLDTGGNKELLINWTDELVSIL